MRLSTAGAAASQAGRHEEAYALFQQAHAVFPNARSFRALGATAFQLRRYRLAIEHYEAALSDQRRPLTPEQRAQAENELGVARRLVSHLRVSADPADATLTLDGQAFTAGQSIVVDPGPHELAARRPGYEDEHRTITSTSGEELVVDLTLRPQVTAQPTQTTVIVPTPTVPLQQDITLTADVGFLALGGAILGIGVVGLGGGIGAHAFGQSAIDSWNTSVSTGSCPADHVGESADCQTLFRRYEDSQPWLYVGYIGGGALSLTGILLMVLAPRVPVRASTASRWQCAPGPGELGLSCGAEF
ncbi:MAG: PEGA domain-containing protein [Sandaracinus sp.]